MGALLVTDADGEVVGILTATDVLGEKLTALANLQPNTFAEIKAALGH